MEENKMNNQSETVTTENENIDANTSESSVAADENATEAEKAEPKKKPKKTPKQIVGLIFNVIIWIFVAFAICITVIIFASFGNDDGIPSFGKTMWVSIQSDSMKGVFSKGDLILAEKLTQEEAKNLQVGDIITFYSQEDINQDGQYNDMNTHRIIEIVHTSSGIDWYKTKGDNNELADFDSTPPNMIIAKYTGKISGLGSVIDFMKTKLGFGLCIVIPVIALFIYYLVMFVSLIKPKKKVTAEEEAEIKRLAVEEYLRQQKAAEADSTPADTADTANTADSADTVKSNSTDENKD